MLLAGGSCKHRAVRITKQHAVSHDTAASHAHACCVTWLQVGWSGVPHIDGKMGQIKDYSSLIQKAQVGAVIG